MFSEDGYEVLSSEHGLEEEAIISATVALGVKMLLMSSSFSSATCYCL